MGFKHHETIFLGSFDYVYCIVYTIRVRSRNKSNWVFPVNSVYNKRTKMFIFSFLLSSHNWKDSIISLHKPMA